MKSTTPVLSAAAASKRHFLHCVEGRSGQHRMSANYLGVFHGSVGCDYHFHFHGSGKVHLSSQFGIYRRDPAFGTAQNVVVRVLRTHR